MQCVALPSGCPLINLPQGARVGMHRVPTMGTYNSAPVSVCSAETRRDGGVGGHPPTEPPVVEGHVPKRLSTRAVETSRPALLAHSMHSRTPYPVRAHPM